MPSPENPETTTILLRGGPLDGLLHDLNEPWPRFGFFKLVVDGEDTRYYLDRSTLNNVTPAADFVGPLEFRGSSSNT